MPSQRNVLALSDRDVEILRLVARFKQLTAGHIRQLVFKDSSNRTPSDRTLLRLSNAGYLQRIERRLVGGARGGSGQYCYGLGRQGYYLFHTGRYMPARVVSLHTLGIADTYVALRQLHDAGTAPMAGISTEPDCWVTVAGIDLRPDLRVDFEVSPTRTLIVFLELDMGTEGQRQLRGKLDAYYRAWQDADAREWPSFPPVFWVTVDVERANELRYLIRQLDEDAQGLFRVKTMVELPAYVVTVLETLRR